MPASDVSPPPAVLPPTERFARRHIGPDESQRAAMLSALGVGSLDALIAQAVPAVLRSRRPLSLPPAATEVEALAELAALAGRNEVRRSLLGLGYYDTVTPPVVLRNILENPGWYTAYTPYQAEISQGRMEALLNFQTMVAELCGLDIANASMLDEGTAAAEAMTMSWGLTHATGSDTFFVDVGCHPQTLAVLRTRAAAVGIEIVVGDPATWTPDVKVFGALVQYPATDGSVRDHAAFTAAIHAAGGMVVAATDLLALTLLTPPGAWGADIAVGSAQRFGVPMGYGGPHAGFFATRDEHKRHMPGRLIGVSIDRHGKPAMRLTLQTREQHIRREKATSNICTAQVLLAVIASMYAVYHGPEGLLRIARRVHGCARLFAEGVSRLGCTVDNATFFDTVTVRCTAGADAVMEAAAAAGVNLRRVDDDRVAVAFDELSDEAEVQRLLPFFAPRESTMPALTVLAAELPPGIEAGPLARRTPFLTHPVFHSHRSETEMLRYIHKLEAKDLSLNTSMIPLGSCTMKLNATTEMIPVTMPGFGRLHPFAPVEQAQGYAELFGLLEGWLAAITGFSATSLQPNAGSQGEYAGLLVIRRYHEARGHGHRNVCLIPTSAHGTNPASAAMAHMTIVLVKCDDHGNIDVADLRARAEQHRDNLAALMVTYPSTHGVFEAAIREICTIIHDNGGLVYMDGANLNAQVGLMSPGDLGADVCHINLHKTFCIPHGGGGPGMGPICCNDKLAPFLPGHPLVETGGERAIGPVSAAPWGSASILTISWAYIRMMGADGLTDATKVAILNANYLAARLAPYFPVLYTGENGRVAHECILDLRPLKATTGVEVEDVAKRLMDYGFHAPTVSFPVVGTLMVEPTESEPQAELDRFADALIAIHGEMMKVADGTWPRDDNPLKMAPHTAEDVTADDWSHPYPRSLAAFPAPWVKANKFWPSVGRVNNVYGDRNVMCSCPPVESYGQG